MRLSRVILSLAAATSTASAQLIAPKTVPVAQGDQFDIFPSKNLGMAGVSIAVKDSLLDPFINPAKLTRVEGSRVFGSPLFYQISGDAGGGRTLPLGTIGRAGEWSGGLTLAIQQLDRGQAIPGFTERLSDRTAMNKYAFGMAGRRLPGGVSVGGSLYWAGLNAVDGVDLLYAGSQSIDQFGHMLDARVGATKEWDGDRTLEVLALHNRFDMTHDVKYATWRWDPVTRQGIQGERVDHNQDQTNTWGLHLKYERPLTADGWRMGWVATGNVLSHPKIPNYDIMSIPRDPGHSYAYNFGVGLARVRGPATVALDVIYEPIWSNTWAEAARDTSGFNPTGGPAPVVRTGQKTVENDFQFSNAVVRLGVGRDATFGSESERKTLGVQFGVAMHSITYRLAQQDHVQRSFRTQKENWMEWTPTWGLSFRFPELEIHYHGSYTTGVGRPGVDRGMIFAPGIDVLAASAGTTFIAAPSGPLTLQDVHVVSHQVSFSLPMR